MIKQEITRLFDDYQANAIKDVPRCEFRPNRNPFYYLTPEKVLFKDLRLALKPGPCPDYQKETFIQTLKRYTSHFQLRKSAPSRVLRHTLEYSYFYCLIIFGFYSRQFSGFRRALHVLKETSKTTLYAGTLFSLNQAIQPFSQQLSSDINQKPWFTATNLLASLFVWPLIALIEWNILVSIRKTLFICAFGQLRDFYTEFERFYKLNPDHPSTKGHYEGERIQHPSQDTRKKLYINGNSRAARQRKIEEKQELSRQLLARNNGQRIPSTHLYLIMPQIYRPPTKEQSEEHERKAAEKAQKILDQKGIKWVTIYTDESKIAKRSAESNNQQKKSWFPW